MSTEFPCMVVYPWEQQPDGFVRYRWRYDIEGRIYTVAEPERQAGHAHDVSLWEMRDGRPVIPQRPPRPLHDLTIHMPLAGLLVAWESQKAPTMVELGRFVPVVFCFMGDAMGGSNG